MYRKKNYIQKTQIVTGGGGGGNSIMIKNVGTCILLL